MCLWRQQHGRCINNPLRPRCDSRGQTRLSSTRPRPTTTTMSNTASNVASAAQDTATNKAAAAHEKAAEVQRSATAAASEVTGSGQSLADEGKQFASDALTSLQGKVQGGQTQAGQAGKSYDELVGQGRELASHALDSANSYVKVRCPPRDG